MEASERFELSGALPYSNSFQGCHHRPLGQLAIDLLFRTWISSNFVKSESFSCYSRLLNFVVFYLREHLNSMLNFYGKFQHPSIFHKTEKRKHLAQRSDAYSCSVKLVYLSFVTAKSRESRTYLRYSTELNPGIPTSSFLFSILKIIIWRSHGELNSDLIADNDT